jgi:hypothetical protein
MMSVEKPDPAKSYPYSAERLVPQWTSRKSMAFVISAAICALFALILREQLTLAMLDQIVLEILFPSALAIVLALAPSPAIRLGEIAKDLTVVSVMLSVFGGSLAPVLIACFPLVLAAAALINRTSLFQQIWPERS